MRVKKPALHPMVQPALAEIQSAGVVITPEIVVWLQDAATRIAKTLHRPSSDILDWPAECGGAFLYPISFAAAEWIVSLPKRMQKDIRFLAFACAHSKNAKVLSETRGSIKVALTVSMWIARLTCSMKALRETVDRLLDFNSTAEVPDHTGKRRDDDGDWEWGSVVKSLCMKYPGTTPDYWMYSVSREKAAYLISALAEELPKDLQFTEHEINATNEFRSIVEAIKAGTYGG